MTGPQAPVPRYGASTLGDLARSLFAALGVPRVDDPLGIGPVERACLLFVDGLGWELLAAAGDRAPFLTSLADGPAARPLDAGFPSTTAASVASIGTGLPPGEHGLVGYTFALPEHDRPINALRWELYGSGPRVDVRSSVEPESFQPKPTLFERAAEADVVTVMVGPREHDRSGLTRAVLRGGEHRSAFGIGDLVASAIAALGEPGPRLVFAYHPDLDTTAHVRGVASEATALHLGHVDRLAAELAERLPVGSALVVTGDHGMVDLEPADKVDVADDPTLAQGVRMLAGEARARHVYAETGAADDVLATWREALADRMWILAREEAIEAGWFGPRLSPGVRPRIGDVVAAAFGPVGVFQRAVDPRQAQLVGHHGSLTPAEQLVPFLIHRV